MHRILLTLASLLWLLTLMPAVVAVVLLGAGVRGLVYLTSLSIDLLIGCLPDFPDSNTDD